MTESLTPRELRQSVAAKLATMPTGVDHDGRSDLDRAVDAATIARLTEVETDADQAARFESETAADRAERLAGVQPPMLRNALQGGSGATVAAPAPTNPLEAIRLKASKLV